MNEHIQTHVSFASVYHAVGPVVPKSGKFWKTDNGPYDYPHSGFAWAWTRDTLDRIGGMFELVDGQPATTTWRWPSLANQIVRCRKARTQTTSRRSSVGDRARSRHIRQARFRPRTIEHWFHGRKHQRYYLGRWDMFLKHQFDPIADLKRNTFGVIEFAGNKPDLELDFDRYLRRGMRDVNTLT